MIPFVRFLVYFLMGQGAGHIQSLIFGSAMLVASLLSLAILVLADLLRTNRVLLEEQLERTKELQYGGGVRGPGSDGSVGSSGQGPGSMGPNLPDFPGDGR